MSDFDPTTNRIPFGLLSEDEQTALMDWPHGFEFWREDDGWDHVIPCWDNATIYRGKPAPVVFNVYPSNAHKRRAISNSTPCSDSRIAVLRIDTCNGVSTTYLEEV